MDNEFVITEQDINEYMDCPGDLFSRSDEKMAFIQYEKGKFIMEYERKNYKNGCLIEGREPTLEQIPGFLKTLIGKDVREVDSDASE